MRICARCQTEMVETYYLITHQAHPIRITPNEKDFIPTRLGKPNLAICPACGEISIYMDDEGLEKLHKYLKL